ncbi:MAG: hypothetical protein GY753_06995 [Gammaproteobacteria bacterium]|nr:hypothetical protein [Gammaproteobacteria bacterium]
MKKEYTKESFPTITAETMDALHSLFPKKFPDLQDKDREIWYNVGRQSVITLLEEIHQMQNGNMLGTTP